MAVSNAGVVDALIMQPQEVAIIGADNALTSNGKGNVINVICPQ